jgi:hypothetical protein
MFVKFRLHEDRGGHAGGLGRIGTGLRRVKPHRRPATKDSDSLKSPYKQPEKAGLCPILATLIVPRRERL